MSDTDGSRPSAEVRLAAYLMSGSLRYAEEVADAADAVASPEATGGRTGGGADSSPAALTERRLADLTGLPVRTLPLWAGSAATAAGAESAGPDAAGRPPGPWLEPFPDDLYPEWLGPASGYDPRETIDLESVAALQLLPREQRARIVLHDVLGLEDAAEAGPSAAREAFAAARAALPAAGPAGPSGDESAVMMRLIFSCESADRDGLRALLAPDATLQSVPDGVALTGRDAVADRLLGADDRAGAAGTPAAGLQRLLPRRANGRLAFGVYRRTTRDELFRAHALWVVTVAGAHVAGVASFTTPSLFPAFDLLPELAPQGERPV